ncbi:shugoshin 1-like [Mobula birostris]|uniref:shugoshin 1-like n=1 Tax=Mobula birostris TaxID=1983395 RepID=UPI003B27F661
MADKKCQKVPIQENLEAIKERMKEKRSQAQAKINRAKQTLNSKVNSKVLNKNSFIKSIQANNQSLALSLEAEKQKLRVASDIILSLKKERQAMIFYILMLKKQVENYNLKQDKSLKLNPHSIDGELSILEEDLLHGLPDCSSPIEPFIHDVPLENSKANCVTSVESINVPSTTEDIQHLSIKLSSGRRSTCNQSPDSDSNAVAPLKEFAVLPKGVSIRRRSGRKKPSFSGCSDALEFIHTSKNYPEISWANEEQKIVIDYQVNENVSDSLNSNLGPDTAVAELGHLQIGNRMDPEKVKSTFRSNMEMMNSKSVQKLQPNSEKGEEVQLEIEQKVRDGKMKEGNKSIPAKKHWEAPKPRTRSKSRDQSKNYISKERKKSLDYSDAYNFDNEESIHLTPFRRKDEPIVVANIDSTKSSVDTESNSEDDLVDSPYIPPADKRRRKSNYKQNKNEGPVVLTTRSRSNRMTATLQKKPCRDREITEEIIRNELSKTPDNVANNELRSPTMAGRNEPLHAELDREPGNTSEFESMKNFQDPEESRIVEHFKPVLKKCLLLEQKERDFGPRFSLSDVTNCSSLPAENKGKEMPYPGFLDNMNVISPIAVHRRRCNMTVNYKEPNLHLKLRRGDKYTDTQFLYSPIFKQKKTDGSRRKSSKKQSPFSRYNEAFVSCR